VTKIVIVDDHPVVREGLVAALAGTVTAAFGSAEEALAVRLDADVIVLDLELPGLGGIDAIARFKAPVLVLTAYGTEEDLERALAAGARGYLLKGAPLEQIERAIEIVAGGGEFIDPRIRRSELPRLSARERDVLKLVAAGESNKDIARRLRITERTAKFHVTSIFNKLGAENRAQAVSIAAEKRLL
jgi:DNA-binding NarL/FixJ family response regulator